MPYKKSLARRGLESSYKDIVGRLRAVEGKGTNPDVRGYVISAAIFLAHAVIENYIEDLFASFARCVLASCAKSSLLPPNLQSHLFIHRSNAKTIFASFITSNSEKEMIRSFSTSLRGQSGGLINDAIVVPAFVGKDIYTDYKYPSEKNLRKIFFRIGIKDIFGELNKSLKRDSLTMLESLGSLRTSLAHNGSLPGISPKDVRDRIHDANVFIGSIDRVLYKYTASSFGESVWLLHAC